MKRKLGHFSDYFVGFYHGSATTRLSYLIMGAGQLAHGQIARGLFYLALQAGYIAYMILFGGRYLSMFFENFFVGGTVGRVETSVSGVWDESLGQYVKIVGDNSFHIVLYGILTILLTLIFAVLYLSSVTDARRTEQLSAFEIAPPTFRDDMRRLFDGKFYLVLLALPMLGLLIFTLVPLITMIMIAFTNYDAAHEVPERLFSWVGLSNFANMLSSESSLGTTFWRVLGWTLIWASLATFTSYFFGMLLAILINRRGIALKKLWRTLFASTIAVPQFVSLLIMSKMLDPGGGIISTMLNRLFGYDLQFGIDITQTRVAIIIVNMWIGVPYSMLMCSGILMNIPADLYESARVDGASGARRFFKITLPYMLFVTGPYLITQFIGNINNFNVIYLLSGGGPGDILKYTSGAKGTDLLITWLYKLSLGVDRDYKLASVIGILVFVISATFSLAVYNRSSAVRGEDTFQ